MRLAPRGPRAGFWIAHGFFGLVLWVSARHFVRPGDFLWTDEGSRFAWNMRLNSKRCTYRVSGRDRVWRALSFESLTARQRRAMTNPQLFLDYVQKTVCPAGDPVFAQVRCVATGRAAALLIDPNVDLCRAEYSIWRHNEWIQPHPAPWGSRARPADGDGAEEGGE